MKFFTLFLALFLALIPATISATTRPWPPPSWPPSYRKIRQSIARAQSTLETKPAPTNPDGAIGPTITAAKVKDPHCKINADCAPGTCMSGICVAPLDGAPPPKPTEFFFSVDDLDKIGMGHERRDKGPGKKCRCQKGSVCHKGRCYMKEQKVARDAQPEPVESLAPGEEGEIVKDLGDDFGEVDETTAQLNVKEKRESDMTHHDLPGPVDSLAPGDEGEIVKDLGDEFGAVGETTAQLNVKERRESHMTHHGLPGDANDGGNETKEPHMTHHRLPGDANDGGNEKRETHMTHHDLPGDANDGGNEKGCPSSKSKELYY